MSPAEAAKLLNLPAGATADQVEARFLELRASLEARIAKAPTPGLKDKYRASLEIFTSARDVLTHEAGGHLLPMLRRVVPPTPLPATATPVATPPSPATPPRRRIPALWVGSIAAMVALAWSAIHYFPRSPKDSTSRMSAHQVDSSDDLNPVPADQRSSLSASPLYLAVLYNDRTVVAERLAAGDNPLAGVQLVEYATDAGYRSPLQVAFEQGRFSLARILLRYSPQPDPADPQSVHDFTMAFASACGTGLWKNIAVLLEFYPAAPWTYEVLEHLVAKADFPTLQQAARAGADFNRRSEFTGQTLLHFAAINHADRPGLCQNLLRLGVDPNARDSNNLRPFDHLPPEASAAVRAILQATAIK